MPRRRTILALAALWLALSAGPPRAGAGVSSRRHRVATGDSLWKIARANQCTVDELRRANRLSGTSIQPGQRIRIPSCGAPREVAKPANRPRRPTVAAVDRSAASEPADDEDGRATRADIEVGESLGLAEGIPDDDDAGEGPVRLPPDRGFDADTRYGTRHIDADRSLDIDRDAPEHGLDRLDPRRDEQPLDPRGRDLDAPERDLDAPERDLGREPERDTGARRDRRAHIDTGARVKGAEAIVAVPIRGQSFGRPQDGYLVSGKRMPNNPAAYFLRRPERAWGTDHAVDQVVRAIGQVRKRHPRVHPLAIGDFSYRHGGPISMHGSHQSGRDADIGFYFRRPPRSYPRAFAVATADNLDFPATWALISALLRTAGTPRGVERIYMTYTTQALFYRLARKHGVPRARLDAWFQYPHGRRSGRGLIRHEPGHDEHIHVRFRCAPADAECE